MLNRYKAYFQNVTLHPNTAIILYGVMGVLVGSLVMFQVYTYQETNSSLKKIETESIEVLVDTSSSSSLFARSAPVSLRIPKIQLETAFESPLDLNPDQTIQIPKFYDTVGWYKYGPTPGEVGPAVVLGHVDSFAGPAVFYNLDQLEVGDRVYITRDDGTEAVFSVTYSERYKQENFPTELVYGQVSFPELRLVTCTGIFSKREQRYSHNLVVYAKLIN